MSPQKAVALYLAIAGCCLTSLPTRLEAASCEVGSAGGYWKLVDTLSPGAWDGVFVYSSQFGEMKYQVDWCGYWTKKEKECSINCRGTTSSFGTTFNATNGAKPCKPESARVYQWVCNNCETAYEKALKECEENEFLYWNNQTCSGSCQIKKENQGPPDQCPTS